ncbi:BlaR1 peptidase M56 [Tenacibaculum skagerrakense]|uniref:BlaR1 peptidase M56 n=1 Tax=Tenacibaculum skagerrakense TaxID=186571 RepID=A0A4R2NRK0_9FLAO|nr:M23/M56 family metallopeptidase [Tenacibaculum skagerrakense]TCP24352.1 BlaR1 peptidase M56 [Tenacibaculum skagerrakense]
MNSFIFFLCKVSIVFTLLYIIYRLLFNNHTFYQLNRIVLLLFIPLSIYTATLKAVIPIETKSIEIPSFSEIGTKTVATFLNIEQSTNTKIKSTKSESPILYIYILGSLFFLFSFIKSLLKLYQLKRNSTSIKKGKYSLIYSNVTQTFSCFNWIFLPTSDNNKDKHIIIEHEKKHVDYLHTFDLLLTELFIVVFWFNPFVYLYRKSLKSIHEYQVDNELLTHQNINKIDYLNLLKREIENSIQTNLYSYFGHPTIKKRIKMIAKSKSNTMLKIKYLAILPVIFLLMVSFTKATTILPIKKVVYSSKPSISPIKSDSKIDITAQFGLNKHPFLKNTTRQHNGIDIRAAVGTTIVATADGVIASASSEGNWGNLLIIKHENGFETLYAHLNSFNCKKGQVVKKGEVIGYSGETGKVKGPHLHYAIKLNNEFVNPIDYIK